MNSHDDARAVRTPVEMAREAAESVRVLNHVTLWGGYVWPADVDDVIGELLLLAERLPQALTQAQCWLEDEDTAGRVGHDSDPTATHAAVMHTTGALDDAQLAVTQLAQSLRTAREASSHLTGRPAPTRHGDTNESGVPVDGGAW